MIINPNEILLVGNKTLLATFYEISLLIIDKKIIPVLNVDDGILLGLVREQTFISNLILISRFFWDEVGIFFLGAED